MGSFQEIHGRCYAAVDDAARMGFDYFTGPELEFFLLKPSDGSLILRPHDSASY
jgi:glutamine synthetase